jgi:alpha-beta hydrolase superfamily lysophospholipase
MRAGWIPSLHLRGSGREDADVGSEMDDEISTLSGTQEPVELRRIEARFEGADGRSLFRRAWLPLVPQRALVVVHGFGEHSGRYETLARSFGARGYAVHAYDHTGHGQSSGVRGHVSDFSDFLDDLERFLTLVREEHPGLPCVLVGHSMGGLVVASLAGQRAPEVDCIVTSGPALEIGKGVSPMKLKLARVIQRLWPTLSMDAGLDVNGLSRDPDVVRDYQADPLVHGKATASLGASMTEAVERAQDGAPDVQHPMLMLHGADDPLCDPAGSRRFFDRLPHERVRGSAIRIYPDLRHEIFNEPEREQVYGDMQAWIDERLAAGQSQPEAPGAAAVGGSARGDAR